MKIANEKKAKVSKIRYFIVIVVLIIVLGLVIWYVWNRNNSEPEVKRPYPYVEIDFRSVDKYGTEYRIVNAEPFKPDTSKSPIKYYEVDYTNIDATVVQRLTSLAASKFGFNNKLESKQQSLVVWSVDGSQDSVAKYGYISYGYKTKIITLFINSDDIKYPLEKDDEESIKKVISEDFGFLPNNIVLKEKLDKGNGVYEYHFISKIDEYMIFRPSYQSSHLVVRVKDNNIKHIDYVVIPNVLVEKGSLTPLKEITIANAARLDIDARFELTTFKPYSANQVIKYPIKVRLDKLEEYMYYMYVDSINDKKVLFLPVGYITAQFEDTDGMRGIGRLYVVNQQPE
ncbi:MAG: hypothetical protein N3A71_00160 [Candidatus Dojkabacteria bacterium]|nr:hypothetical protein [Candidatus Dojkabacteria bacterium]